VTFDATVPENPFTVNFDSDTCEIMILTLRNNSWLNILPSKYYTMDSADIYGIINADSGGFSASPFYLLGNRARVYASNGANVGIGSGDPSNDNEYSSTGLWASAYGSHTRYWDLLKSCGTNTLLDLSSVASIDAGFNDNDGDDNNIQRFIACEGGKIDLSGLESVTAPVGLWDGISFILSENSTIDLKKLDTITPDGRRGYAMFDVTNGGRQYLPSLENMVHLLFDLDAGSIVSVDDPNDSQDPPPASYSSTGLWASAYGSHSRNMDLWKACGTNTLLDLSSVASIDAGFNDNDGDDYNIQRFIACEGGKIDLSGLQEIIPPVRGEDRLDFIAKGGSITIGDLSSGGSINVLVESYEPTPAMLELAPDAEIIPGELHVLGDLKPATGSKRVNIVMTGAEGEPHTSQLIVDGDINIEDPNTLILSEGSIQVKGNFQFNHTDEERVKTADSIVQFAGNSNCSEPQLLEIGGLDVDVYVGILANDNFAIGQLIVGQELQATCVRLQDALDNGNRGGCVSEVLYLNLEGNYQRGLRILGGSTLNLGMLNVYSFEDGEWVHINSLFEAGQNKIAYDQGYIEKGTAPCWGDFDKDLDIDGSDLAVFAADYGRTNCNSPPLCEGDFDGDNDVDGSDLACFASHFGRTDCPY
jgi:hypothetical protein